MSHRVHASRRATLALLAASLAAACAAPAETPRGGAGPRANAGSAETPPGDAGPRAGAAAGDPAALARAQAARAARSLAAVADLPALLAGSSPVAVLDVRGADAFAAGHLPGAVRVEYEEWEQASLGAETGLDHEATWHARLGAHGLTGRERVLVLDDGRMTRAARIWFILQHVGAADAAVVDGGFPRVEEAVRAGALSLATGAAAPAEATFEPAAERAGRIGVLDRVALKAAIEAGEVQVLDARSRDEFLGVDARGNPRAGHLPDAVSLPHRVLLDARGCLLAPDELARLLEEAGFVRGRVVVTHCQGGGRAALAALACARAGFGPVVNYYLSFGDWARDATCPVVHPGG